MKGSLCVYGVLCALLCLVGALAWESEDIEIVGIGENCGLRSVCDKRLHLICKESSCQCDTDEGFVLEEDKCVKKDGDASGNSEEDESSEEAQWAPPAEEKSEKVLEARKEN